MILDGEAVVLDGTGRSNFGMLQGRCAAVELAGHSRGVDTEPAPYHLLPWRQADLDTVGPAALGNISR